MSSQDKLRVTTHPVGVTKHPAWSNNNLHLGPLLGPPSQSIKHRLFNCLLTRALSGGPPQPPIPYGRERVTTCSQICTYHGIKTRYMKGYTARLMPPH